MAGRFIAVTDQDPPVHPITNPLQRATLYDNYDLELILVRHGQQIPPAQRANAAERLDPPLTEVGERQIEAVGAHLANEDITAVYASTLTRARRTGEAIAAHQGVDATIVHELREIEILRDRPADTAPTDLVDPLTWAGAGERFVQTGKWDEWPMSESSFEFRRRICQVIEGIIATERTGRVAVACHGGVINTYLAEQLGISRDFWFRTAHCAVNRVYVKGDRRVIWNLNEVHHLPGELATA